MSSEQGHTLSENLSRNLRLIYSLRENRKRNLEDFSSELGISHGTLQNIFSQRSNLRLDTVEIIAQRLNTPPIQLLSQQYPEAEVNHAALLLETVELFSALPPKRRKEAAALFCRLLALLAQEEQVSE